VMFKILHLKWYFKHHCCHFLVDCCVPSRCLCFHHCCLPPATTRSSVTSSSSQRAPPALPAACPWRWQAGQGWCSKKVKIILFFLGQKSKVFCKTLLCFENQDTFAKNLKVLCKTLLCFKNKNAFAKQICVLPKHFCVFNLLGPFIHIVEKLVSQGYSRYAFV
jgi:hypothetical protein